MWFWEYSPKYWTPFQWGVFFVTTLIMIAVMIFGCGIVIYVNEVK